MNPDIASVDSTKNSRVAALNDEFRSTLVGGQILLTPGVNDLSNALRTGLLNAVRTFSAFTPHNNPYGERDFGSIDINQERFFWKIDYYNADCTAGSDDPSNQLKTTRVLTIMRADEY